MAPVRCCFLCSSEGALTRPRSQAPSYYAFKGLHGTWTFYKSRNILLSLPRKMFTQCWERFTKRRITQSLHIMHIDKIIEPTSWRNPGVLTTAFRQDHTDTTLSWMRMSAKREPTVKLRFLFNDFQTSCIHWELLCLLPEGGRKFSRGWHKARRLQGLAST